ncbi:MAG: hypothetical protein H6Q69_1828 [Firmicutes bacterium]|nr:hypothetical protein [Bacillota bacterium]
MTVFCAYATLGTPIFPTTALSQAAAPIQIAHLECAANPIALPTPLRRCFMIVEMRLLMRGYVACKVCRP